MKFGVREFPAAICRRETKSRYEPRHEIPCLKSNNKVADQPVQLRNLLLQCLDSIPPRVSIDLKSSSRPLLFSVPVQAGFLARGAYFQVTQVWLPGIAMPNPDSAEY